MLTNKLQRYDYRSEQAQEAREAATGVPRGDYCEYKMQDGKACIVYNPSYRLNVLPL